ncbi:hypothetical protein HYR99_13250 [Candidatus Poribacteria bacterium]|nr:hypothetical protein [Candidatus Poribacteria bacterium]
MRKLFLDDLIAAINKKLDLEGLQSLDDKEIAVLLSEQMTHSSTLIIDELSNKIDGLQEELGDKIDGLSDKIDGLGDKIDGLREELSGTINALGKELSGKIDGLGKELQLLREDVAFLRSGAKLLIGTLWAVIASIIANIIFQIIMK